ncbi:MAG TPA: hypothetical protein ENK35_07410 [Candidatus Tenderia sp.]|nr:hypothetical protein [Candidatus Tenderia sp.]
MDALVNSSPQITIAGESRDALQSSVVSIRVTQPINGMSHMELNLVNWGQGSDNSEPGFMFNDINLGDEIDVEMGLGQQQKVFSGEITALEEHYGNGAPQLVVLAEDKLHRLARIRQSRSHEEMSADDVIQSLIEDTGLQGDISVSTIVDTFNQINESNLAYILRLGRRYGINARIVENQLRMRAEEESRDAIEVDLQRDVVSARITADLNHQPLSCKQRGWNPDTDDEARGQSQTLSTTGRSAEQILNDLGWPGEDLTPCPFPSSNGQAEAYAQAHFERRARHFVEARLRLGGNPALKAGEQLVLRNGSPRFNGTYRIQEARHIFDRRQGYETHLLLSSAAIEESA